MQSRVIIISMKTGFPVNSYTHHPPLEGICSTQAVKILINIFFKNAKYVDG